MKKSNQIEKLYNLPEYEGRKDNLQLLRIVSTSEYVKADFGYYATNYYIRGGWVRIDKETFLRDVKTGQKKKLIKTLNIPIAPNDLKFKTSHDWLYFSLCFEPISDSVKLIDIIEAEQGDSSDFNFYNIHLKEFLKIKS